MQKTMPHSFGNERNLLQSSTEKQHNVSLDRNLYTVKNPLFLSRSLELVSKLQ